MRKILIVGAGVAGTAAALALRRAGFDPVVFEGHPDSAEDIGAFLTLAGNGTRALAELDVAKAVGRVGFPLHTLEFREISRALEGQRCLRRADLCRVLQTEAARRGIPVHHGKKLLSISEDADGVTARFADSGIARGDLLIGADGLNSTVRKLLNPGGPEPRYAGQQVFYGYARLRTPPCEPGRIVMVRGASTNVGYTVSPGREVWWFARVRGEPLPWSERLGPAWRARLLALLRQEETPCAAIVEASRGPLLGTNARDLADVPVWHTDRTVLLGDAAHAASPATGQGASMALEDAIVLAKALRDTDSPFATYERVRRPRVSYNTEASARLTDGRAPQDAPPPVGEEELSRQLDFAAPLELSPAP